MANLEETHEAELDAILGELSLLEQHAKSTTTTTTVSVTAAKNLNMNGIAADYHGGGVSVKTINNHLQNGSTTATAIMMSPSSCAGAVGERNGRTHSRSNSTISGVTNSSISISSESGNGSGSDSSGGSSNGIGGINGSSGSGSLRESRTESPDNDSAFSDTVSLLSSESSASSNISNLMGNSHGKNILSMNMNLLQVCKQLHSNICVVKVLR